MKRKISFMGAAGVIALFSWVSLQAQDTMTVATSISVPDPFLIAETDSVARDTIAVPSDSYQMPLLNEEIMKEWRSPNIQSVLRKIRETAIEKREKNNGIVDISIAEKSKSMAIEFDDKFDESYEFFYYFFNKKIPLVASDHEIVVKFNKNVNENQKEELLNTQNFRISSRKSDLDIISFAGFPGEKIKNENLDSLRKSGILKFANPVFTNISQEPMLITDQIIVKYKNSVSRNDITSIQGNFGVEFVENVAHKTFPTMYIVSIIDPNLNTLDVANALHEHPLVEYAHPNFIIPIQFHYLPPDDPYFGVQEVYSDPFRPDQANLHSPPGYGNYYNINILDAWDITTGDPDVIVAILDTGIDYGHEDFAPWSEKFVSGYDVSDSMHHKPISPINGYYGSYDPDSAAVHKRNAHGTAAAGIVAATTNNGKGIAGIAPLSKIMSVRIAPASDISTISWISVAAGIRGITTAKENGASVINMSYGGTSNISAEFDAVQDAYLNGMSLPEG